MRSRVINFCTKHFAKCTAKDLEELDKGDQRKPDDLKAALSPNCREGIKAFGEQVQAEIRAAERDAKKL